MGWEWRWDEIDEMRWGWDGMEMGQDGVVWDEMDGDGDGDGMG